MLRPNGDTRKIRKSNFVFVSHCTINSEKAWHSKRLIFAMLARHTKYFFPSGQKQSSIKTIFGRRATSKSAILGAFPGFYSVYNIASATNITSVDCRDWRNVKCLDKTQENTRVVWVKTLRYLAATGTTGLTPVHDVLTGTTPHLTRTTTSGRALSVTTPIHRFDNATAYQADQSKCGQPILSCFGKYLTGFGITLSSSSKGAADFSMAKKHRNLIQQITTTDNLQNAYLKTSKNKKMTFGYLEFKEYDQANLRLIREELLDGAYKIGEYKIFTIYEPKPRTISALQFKDRLVQHAVCNIISPIFEKTLMPQTFACRVGKGTHAGVKFVQSTMRQTKAKYFLKTDYSKFFPSIDLSVLHTMIDRKIDCDGTLQILREIIPTEGKGIPIGSLTSQLFANVYGNAADRFLHFDLNQKHWARYMDDIVVMGDNQDKLMDIFLRLNDWSMQNLKLNIGKWHILPTTRGVNFLGYRIWSTHKLLRHDSVIRAKRKVNKYLQLQDDSSLEKFLASWLGHAKWADTHNLLNWLEKKHGIAI